MFVCFIFIFKYNLKENFLLNMDKEPCTCSFLFFVSFWTGAWFTSLYLFHHIQSTLHLLSSWTGCRPIKIWHMRRHQGSQPVNTQKIFVTVLLNIVASAVQLKGYCNSWIHFSVESAAEETERLQPPPGHLPLLTTDVRKIYIESLLSYKLKLLFLF